MHPCSLTCRGSLLYSPSSTVQIDVFRPYFLVLKRTTSLDLLSSSRPTTFRPATKRTQLHRREDE